MNRKRFCGSCGKPMKEKDGSKSEKICNIFYENGVWTQPTVAFDAFYTKCYEGFLNSDMNKFKKMFVKKCTQKNLFSENRSGFYDYHTLALQLFSLFLLNVKKKTMVMEKIKHRIRKK